MQLFRPYGKIFVEGFDGRQLPRPGRRRNTILRRGGIRVDGSVISKIGQEIEDIRCVDIPDECNVNALNVNILQICCNGHIAAHELDKPEEHPQVQVVF